MHLGHSTFIGTAGPCWHCSRFAGLVYAGSAARCSLPNAPRVRATPASGCAFWAREVGADDEPGPPGSPDAQKRLKPAPVYAPAVEWAP